MSVRKEEKKEDINILKNENLAAVEALLKNSSFWETEGWAGIQVTQSPIQ